MRGTARGLTALVLVASVLLTACGGGDTVPDVAGTSDGSTTAPTDEGEQASATLTTLDAQVEWAVALAADASWEAVAETRTVAIGEAVRTDEAGFAQIDYPDGSLTRLDAGTSYEIVELATFDAGAQQVRGRLDVGQTWHRVKELVGESSYEVETAVANIAVRGTAFVVHCPEQLVCFVRVLEGEVEVTPNGRGPLVVGVNQSVRVTQGGAGPVVDVEEGMMRADVWAERNLPLDEEQGFAQPAPEGRPVVVAGTIAMVEGPPFEEGGEPVRCSGMVAEDGTRYVLKLDTPEHEWGSNFPDVVEKASGQVVAGEGSSVRVDGVVRSGADKPDFMCPNVDEIVVRTLTVLS